ncbi:MULTISPECIES: hypothetical protein [unclassified Aquimarina]|uniref:hypothetical protein n=1 Tax=unclassified Aquimarina TaxID=2627091 RepID=UPI0018CA096A|nr:MULTISPECIES: hypothetical protein [unclassified Aquimarina]MBG6149305.1 hypothetical protein [Aquimarina sp. EL_32]
MKNWIFILILVCTGLATKAQITEAPNGNVGIGTTTPSSKLHVNGDVKMNIGEGFRLFGDTEYFGQYLDAIIFEMQDGNSSGGATDGGFVFRGYTPTDQIAKEWMTIKSGGKVGIGTSAPASKLHVNGDLKMNIGEGFRLFGDTEYFGQYLDAIIFEMQDSNSSNGGTDGGFVFRGYTPTDQIAKEWMTIKSGGKVGIGTSNTGSHRLAVEGSIGAREVVVEAATWSDFVFYDDYKLPTLQEVENHINQKGHLQDIPSASEVQENGIFLGEMDAKLLQKIEELTLYIIQMNKRIELLEKENQLLKK